MPSDTGRSIDELEGMGAAALRERYEAVFGEPSRSGNRRWLIRRIAWRLQALAEGGLSERAQRRAEELSRDEDLRVRPPRDLARHDLKARLAAPPAASPMPNRDARLPIPGAVLVREFKGVEHRVAVLPNGFELQTDRGGETYRSLSAVAHAISGSHWNGFHFFGLGKRGGAKRTEDTA